MDNVIDLKLGPEEDGKILFTFVGEKWRCGSYERRKAEGDKARIDKRLEAKEKL